MSEDDSTQVPHRKTTRRPKKLPPNGQPVPTKRDEFIMDTNSSSIVSKRSVEKLYYPEQPSYFRYFVKKFQRRSPLINRGYWLRMKAIEKIVEDFLQCGNDKTKVVVNLGCGYDPLPFQFLGGKPQLCGQAVFVDVDYSPLVQRKVTIIQQNPVLRDLVPGMTIAQPPSPLLGDSERYKVVGCDLKDVGVLDRALRGMFDLEGFNVAILFVAEVSVAYMDQPAANAVLKWAAGLQDARFCLLEQHLPDGPGHPFAQTMLSHFEKLRTPLNAIGTIPEMRRRFVNAGWSYDRIRITPLWQLWSNPSFLSAEGRKSLDDVEPFDEWEEFALFASHYFLLISDSGPKQAGLDESVAHDQVQVKSQGPLLSCRYSTLKDGNSKRRFGAVACSRKDLFAGHYGGLAERERTRTADIYSAYSSQGGSGAVHDLALDIPTAVMCHSITPMGYSHLLVGGRTSPDKASAKCWLLRGGVWRETSSLPLGRYRHAAIEVSVDSTERTDGQIDIGRPKTGVMVVGGKASSGKLSDDWLLYTEDEGWTKLEILQSDDKASLGDQTYEPSFGATILSFDDKGRTGIIFGGMRSDGTVVRQCKTWTLHCEGQNKHVSLGDGKAKLRGLEAKHLMPYRFGAQTIRTSNGTLIIGGIGADGVLHKDEEVVHFESESSLDLQGSSRPLLIGMSLCPTRHGVLVLGGGATCFSFGTRWNNSGIIHAVERDDAPTEEWRVGDIAASAATGDRWVNSAPPDNTWAAERKLSSSAPRSSIRIIRRTLHNPAEFESLLQAAEPVILERLDIGSCTKTWTESYLKDKVGSCREVVIHDSSTPNMNFQNKNFAYKKLPFGEFLDAASRGAHMYLRALSTDKPAETATSLSEDFPSLADDFILPPQLKHVHEHAHSSPLRITGMANMWLHYDVMANVLCQVRGSKRLTLFPPGDVCRLGIPAGASSSTLDVFTKESESSIGGTTRYEAVLEPGDVLLIPPLWLHASASTNGLSVAVNVFFRDGRLEAAYAAGKDVYGNRDIAAYERGRRDVLRIAGAFDGMPASVRQFYLSRLAQELDDAAAR